MALTPKHLETLKQLLSHPSDDFVELARIAGLRLDKDFRHANLRGVDFGTANTSGWDFTDSDLSDADLSQTRGAPPKTAGARIDGTKLPTMGLGQVFISYANENRDVVSRLAEELRASGVTIWLDRNDIEPGSRWRDSIKNAIRSSAFFIACFSKEYNQRQRTYMNEELALAIEELRNKPSERTWFIPVLINEAELPSRAISATENLSDIQFVNLYEDWDEGIKSILRVLSYAGPVEPSDTVRSAPLAERVPSLVAALRNVDVRVRTRAANALGGIGRAAFEAVPTLATALNDHDADVRRSAADALGRIGEAASEAVPTLATALNDQDVDVRRSAAGALGKIGEAASEAVPTLAAALNDQDVDVRRSVADALARIRGAPRS